MYRLPEIKKELKKVIKDGGSVSKIHIGIQEYGEGYDLHVDCWNYDRWLNDIFESYQVMEEQTLKQCEARGKKIAISLQLAGYKATFTGLANC